jgi:thioredoxin-dependent peroxiredoxin
MSNALKTDDLAPDFSATDDSGNTVTLSELRGKTVILYFYPKDDTPGCTKEACAFQAGLVAIKRKKAVVLGVSPDSVKSHAKFRDKFSLAFPLLADEDHAIAEAYGVWKEKQNYGRTYMGVERTTYVIDPRGRIAKIFPKVKVDGHFEEVLAAL